MASAERVVLSYPAGLSDWGRAILTDDPFRAYLPKAHDAAREGDRWPEFVGVGCCGSAMDVTLRVERVEGGRELTPATDVVFEERATCDHEGGWTVQSEAGPTA